MAITTTSIIDGPVNVIFQNTMLREAVPQCPYFYGTVPAEIRAHAGSFTARWRRFSTLTPTTTALTEINGSVSLPFRQPTSLAITNVDATVSKFGDYVLYSEEMDLKNPNVITDRIMRIIGIQAGQSLNRLQRNEVEDNSTILRAGSVSADSSIGDPISASLITRAVNDLKNQNAMMFTGMATGTDVEGSTPIPPAFFGICHVDVEEDTRKLPGFRPVETYASHTPVKSGEFGMVGQVRFCSTTEASVETGVGGSQAAGGPLRSTDGATVDIYNTVIYGEEALGSVGLDREHVKESYVAGDQLPAIMVMPVEPGGVADPMKEGKGLAWKSWHVAKVLNSNWSRCLRTGANRIT